MALPITVAPRLPDGRLALITGAGQGNARALALGLAQAGARVIATDGHGRGHRTTGTRGRGQGESLGYSPSKGAIKMFTQPLAQELAPLGVRVNALAPGVIETPMTVATRDDPARLQSFMTRIPLGRLGQSEDLVGPVIFLASDMARYVTGVTLAVDGGFLAV